MSNPFDRNPYRLPPPWNPGYALPQNVDDEGLRRHAYTTAWAPRGSFDDPKVGTAGYAVPQYVKDEGYGVGVMVTRWAPRGSYAGPRVPHWLDRQSAKVVGRKPMPGGAVKMQIQSLAGTEAKATGGEAPFAEYGMTSAAALIETVKMMPPDLRTKQLRKALDRIDPKLYSRGEQLATAEAKAGVPATVALERGLAVAMSHGIASELVDLGKGKSPGKRTQLGACLSCMTLLGDYPPVRAGYCWVAATATVPGHWERARTTGCAQDQTGVTASGGPVVRECSATNPSGCPGGVFVASTSTGQQVAVKISAAPPPTPSDQKFLNVGPFLIPTNLGVYRDHRTLSGEKLAFIEQNIAVASKAGGVSAAEMRTGKYPFVRFKANNEDWGLFYRQTADGQSAISYHKISPSMLGSIVGDIGGALVDAAEWVGGAIASVFKKIWAGIKWVAVKVVDFVKDAAEWIKDKACDLFTSPVGQVAGAAAGAYVGGPAGAQAGAMGAQIAAQACSSPPAPTEAAPPQAASGGDSLMPVLLIGGAGIAAILLLGKKKH